MPSEYEKRIRKKEKEKLAEEWDWLQQNQERSGIDVEDLKQQGDMEEGNYLQDPMNFNQAMQIGQHFASQGSPSFDVNPDRETLTESQKRQRDKLWKRKSSGQEGSKQAEDILKKKGIDPTALPNFAQSIEMAEIYRRDAEKNKEFDEAVARGDLKEGVKIRRREGMDFGSSIPIPNISNVDLSSIKEAGGAALSYIGIDPTSDTLAQELSLEFLEMASHVRSGPVKGTATYIASQPGSIELFKHLIDLSKHVVNGKYPQALAIAGGGSIPVNQMFSAIPDPLKRKANVRMIQGSGSGGDIYRGFGQNFVPPNPSEVSKVTRKLLNEHVLVGPNRVFDYNAFRALFTGNKRGRLLEGWMQTTPHFKIPNWDRHRQELVDVFESIYGDVMQLKDIPRSQIQVDHLVTLRSTMPVYDGVSFGSPLWNRIQETLLRSKNRYNPGNTLANLDALDPGSHIVKTNFFNKRIGKDGELFFTKDRLAYMKKSDANRIEVLNDFIEIQDEGTLILREAQDIWEALYKIDSAEMPLDIINRLSEIPVGEFSHPELRNLDQLRAIITDIVESGAKKGRPKKIQNTLKRIFPDVDPDTGDVQGNLFD
jgi:hypothetical protein